MLTLLPESNEMCGPDLDKAATSQPLVVMEENATALIALLGIRTGMIMEDADETEFWGGPHKLDRNWSQLKESRAG